MKIRQLPKEVYDLIAAGEVILGPVSVVKELVENSIDAGASRIVVEITEGGKERIRVSDNGTGISKEDAALAFAPHATSKLASAEELVCIDTLGFRGEALASISTVSSVKMVTRTEEDETGSLIKTEGGTAPEISPASSVKGTDVCVERLFFNIPARKKHMDSSAAESRKIIEYLSKAAISRPDIMFRLISDGKSVFSTLGNGDRLTAAAILYGSKTAENLFPVNVSESDKIHLNGYISGVLGLRRNKKGLHFFVNGRPVKSPLFETAISRAYREFAEPGRFPVVFLFLSIDPSLVDVNVHPAKNEVSFVNSEEVSAFIERSVHDLLCSDVSVPKLRVPAPPQAFVFESELPEKGSETGAGETLVSTSGGKGEKVEMVDIINILSTNKSEINVNNGKADHNNDKFCQVYDNKLRYSEYDKEVTGRGLADNSQSGLIFAENADINYEKTLNINDFSLLATLFATYLLATDGESFYIIDQHAAHERVSYERFLEELNKKEIEKQTLLEPYLFTPPVAVNKLQEYIYLLDELGYETDEFGENIWACRTFPAFLEWREAEVFFLEILDALAEEKDGKIEKSKDKIIKRACKTSVKANQKLSDAENEELIKNLAKCENPFTCPHGRPVFLKLRRNDIERLFKRA